MNGQLSRDARGILFIAYHFPPSAAIGGRRIAQFATALRSLAWRPHVLTIADADIETVDRSRLRDVEGIPIHKAPVRRSAMALVERLWSRRRSRQARRSAHGGQRPASASPGAAQATRTGFRRFVLSLLALPDWERGWCLPATLGAVRTVRQQNISWVMTSCPPYSVHLIGLAVKLLTRRRWVADFRDPWMTTGSKRLYPTSRLSLGIERYLERKVIEKADLVVFNVERLRNAYRDRYSWVPAGKFIFIPNGIPAMAGRTTVPRFETFTIAYTGSLYVGRSPEPVFQAIQMLIRNTLIPENDIRVKLVGQCGEISNVPTQDIARKYGLGSIVEVVPSVPYAEAFEVIQRSHLALLLAPNLPYQIPAKVYDYFAAGTRVLAIAEEGGTADLLRDTGAGKAFRSEDIAGIADFIHAEYATRATRHASAPPLRQFDVQRITEELVSHLTRVEARGALR